MQHEIIRDFIRIEKATALVRDNSLKAYELRGHHYFYLRILLHQPGINQERMAELLMVNKSSVARNIARLEEHGIVERMADGGSFRLHLTEKGRMIIEQAEGMVREWYTEIFSDLDENDQKELAGLLEKISKRARSYNDARK